MGGHDPPSQQPLTDSAADLSSSCSQMRYGAFLLHNEHVGHHALGDALASAGPHGHSALQDRGSNSRPTSSAGGPIR